MFVDISIIKTSQNFGYFTDNPAIYVGGVGLRRDRVIIDRWPEGRIPRGRPRGPPRVCPRLIGIAPRNLTPVTSSRRVT